MIAFTFLDKNGHFSLHGARANRTIKPLASGAPARVETTLVDAPTATKPAESHSVNYRRAVCYGRGRLVHDDAVRRSLVERLLAPLLPGRTPGTDYLPLSERGMKPVALVELDIEAMRAKVRSDGP